MNVGTALYLVEKRAQMNVYMGSGFSCSVRVPHNHVHRRERGIWYDCPAYKTDVAESGIVVEVPLLLWDRLNGSAGFSIAV
jgi:hypothetical protein